jgi:hypothetical protein
MAYKGNFKAGNAFKTQSYRDMFTKPTSGPEAPNNANLGTGGYAAFSNARSLFTPTSEDREDQTAWAGGNGNMGGSAQARQRSGQSQGFDANKDFYRTMAQRKIRGLQ